MTTQEERLSWVHEDSALVARLDSLWPSWQDGRMVAQLDQESGWENWDSWSPDDKRTQLGRLLDTWYPQAQAQEAQPVDRIAWVRDDPALVQRLNGVWPAWEAELTATLDGTAEWNGWDAWDTATKRDYLSRTLDAWYPQAATAAPADRIAWIRDDATLVQRLNSVWPGWENGLVATLDQTPEWNGWDAWDTPTKRDYLARTLDAWYPPAAAPEPSQAGTELVSGVTALLNEAVAAVPAADDLSPEQLQQVLAEILAEEIGTVAR